MIMNDDESLVNQLRRRQGPDWWAASWAPTKLGTNQAVHQPSWGAPTPEGVQRSTPKRQKTRHDPASPSVDPISALTEPDWWAGKLGAIQAGAPQAPLREGCAGEAMVKRFRRLWVHSRPLQLHPTNIADRGLIGGQLR